MKTYDEILRCFEEERATLPMTVIGSYDIYINVCGEYALCIHRYLGDKMIMKMYNNFDEVDYSNYVDFVEKIRWYKYKITNNPVIEDYKDARYWVEEMKKESDRQFKKYNKKEI